ncbi:MAG: c-type cytochrome, partial [Acidobacteria bacterium]|nr:c-type cytochrome [Acidobacteriota bacterium]
MSVLILALVAAALALHGQSPVPAPAKPVFRARPNPYPDRPPANPASLERGKAMYGVNCTFCHGADARGGSGGPNLLRSELVLQDKAGERIGQVIREGREGMPRMSLTDQQIEDIANFVHSFKVSGYDQSRMTPPSILVGDAKAGEAYFAATCASCHSVTGNLRGIGSRISDPKLLQQTWLMPGTGGGRGFGGGAPVVRVSPTTVTVTLAGGAKHEGRLNRIDDFFV